MDQSEDDDVIISAKVESDDEVQKEETSVSSSSFEKIYACSYCAKIFAYKKRLSNHLEVCTKKKKKLNKLLSAKNAKKHSKSTVGDKQEKTYECSMCNLVFSQKFEFNRHTTTHSLDKPFECIECRRRFSKKEYLIKHISVHSESKVYSCTVCSYQVSRPDRYKLHMQTHGVSDPFKCSLCGKGFSGLKGLNKHLNSHNSSALDPGANTSSYEGRGLCNFSCVECGLTFEKPEKYKYHMLSHGIEEPYECSLCGESFSSKLHLNRHLSNHNKILQVSKTVSLKSVDNEKCKDDTAEVFAECSSDSSSGAVSSRSEVVESHRNASHSLENDIKEEVISYSDERVSVKNRNADSFSPDKYTLDDDADEEDTEELNSGYNYSCKPCGMKFLTIDDHLEHMKVLHKKLFACLKCGKSYTRRSNLNKHPCGERNSKESHMCKTCGISFPSDDELDAHVMLHISGTNDANGGCNEAEVERIDISPTSAKNSNSVKKKKKPKSKASNFLQEDFYIMEEERNIRDQFSCNNDSYDDQSPKKKKKTNHKVFSDTFSPDVHTPRKVNKAKPNSFFQDTEKTGWEQSKFQKQLTISISDKDSHDKYASEYEKLVVYEFMSMKVVFPESDHNVEDLVHEDVHINDQISLIFFK